ncbi:MAG: NTP transferase domain-containing protein, partial [Actinomycetes bacterium]
MRSTLPKVLHPVAGRPLLGHVIAAARAQQPENLLVVVGHGREQVLAYLDQADPTARVVVQAEQRGTGHAAAVALAALAEQGVVLDGPVVITCGDTPLLRGDTLAALRARHASSGAAVTVLSAVLDDPRGYGRVIRATGQETYRL